MILALLDDFEIARFGVETFAPGGDDRDADEAVTFVKIGALLAEADANGRLAGHAIAVPVGDAVHLADSRAGRPQMMAVKTADIDGPAEVARVEVGAGGKKQRSQEKEGGSAEHGARRRRRLSGCGRASRTGQRMEKNKKHSGPRWLRNSGPTASFHPCLKKFQQNCEPGSSSPACGFVSSPAAAGDMSRT